MKNSKGITLIALVVTIIILLILASVTIGFTMNGTGLFEKAKIAKEISKNAQEDEENKIKQYGNDIDNYINGTRETITLTEEEYNMFKSQFSKNTDITKVSINKPSTWTTEIEYDFGDGVYGKRFTGTITASANSWTNVTLLPAGSAAINIIDCGGHFYYCTNQAVSIGTTWNSNSYNNGLDNMTPNGSALNFGSSSACARTNEPYDIWIIYNKI